MELGLDLFCVSVECSNHYVHEHMWYDENGDYICPLCGCKVHNPIYEEYAQHRNNDEKYFGGLSVYEAARLWLKHGKDNEHIYGWTEKELEAAATEFGKMRNGLFYEIGFLPGSDVEKMGKPVVNMTDWQLYLNHFKYELSGMADLHPYMGRNSRIERTSAIKEPSFENDVMIFESRNIIYKCPLKYMTLFPYRHLNYEEKYILSQLTECPDNIDMILAASAMMSFEYDMANDMGEWMLAEGIDPELIDFSDNEFLKHLKELQCQGQEELNDLSKKEDQRLLEAAMEYEDCIYLELSKPVGESKLAYHIGDKTGVIAPSKHVGTFMNNIIYKDGGGVDFRFYCYDDLCNPDIYRWSENIRQAVIKNRTGRKAFFNSEIIDIDEKRVVIREFFNEELHQLLTKKEVDNKTEEAEGESKSHSKKIKIGGRVNISPAGTSLPRGDEELDVIDKTHFFFGIISGDVDITMDENKMKKISFSLFRSPYMDKFMDNIYPNANITEANDGTRIIQVPEDTHESRLLIVDIYLQDNNYRRLIIPNALLKYPAEIKGWRVSEYDDYYLEFSPQEDESGNTHYEYFGQDHPVNIELDPEEIEALFKDIK
ncbi:hypothetical protein SAMN02910400_00603 [Lachnospiraceae bacterium C10]|nr:hypothetical protein SAMN02910400_00603 [Lachnospiraceae bacterium C10]